MNQIDKLIKKIKTEDELGDLQNCTNYSLLWKLQTNLLKYYEMDEFWGKVDVQKIRKFLTFLFRQRNKIKDEIIRRMERYE